MDPSSARWPIWFRKLAVCFAPFPVLILSLLPPPALSTAKAVDNINCQKTPQNVSARDRLDNARQDTQAWSGEGTYDTGHDGGGEVGGGQEGSDADEDEDDAEEKHHSQHDGEHQDPFLGDSFLDQEAFCLAVLLLDPLAVLVQQLDLLLQPVFDRLARVLELDVGLACREDDQPSPQQQRDELVGLHQRSEREPQDREEQPPHRDCEHGHERFLDQLPQPSPGLDRRRWILDQLLPVRENRWPHCAVLAISRRKHAIRGAAVAHVDEDESQRQSARKKVDGDAHDKMRQDGADRCGKSNARALRVALRLHGDCNTSVVSEHALRAFQCEPRPSAAAVTCHVDKVPQQQRLPALGPVRLAEDRVLVADHLRWEPLREADHPALSPLQPPVISTPTASPLDPPHVHSNLDVQVHPAFRLHFRLSHGVRFERHLLPPAVDVEQRDYDTRFPRPHARIQLIAPDPQVLSTDPAKGRLDVDDADERCHGCDDPVQREQGPACRAHAV
eukprot:3864571-Rhodomonas_salina.2